MPRNIFGDHSLVGASGNRQSRLGLLASNAQDTTAYKKGLSGSLC